MNRRSSPLSGMDSQPASPDASACQDDAGVRFVGIEPEGFLRGRIRMAELRAVAVSRRQHIDPPRRVDRRIADRVLYTTDGIGRLAAIDQDVAIEGIGVGARRPDPHRLPADSECRVMTPIHQVNVSKYGVALTVRILHGRGLFGPRTRELERVGGRLAAVAYSRI